MQNLYQYNTKEEFNLEISKNAHADGIHSVLATFNSPFITGVKENDSVFSEFFFSGGPRKSIVILLHGFSSKIAKLGNYYSFMDYLTETGLDCAFMHQPFHLHRTPAGEKSGERLIYFDDLQTLEFYHQAVVDTRRIIDIATSKFGYNRIILCGFSLGSMVATIATAIDQRIGKTILLLGGGDWYEIHWNSILAHVLKGNCIEDGMITKRKCSEIYKDFPEFLKELKNMGPIMRSEDFKLQTEQPLKAKTTKACFLCDPLAFGHLLNPEKILMINSKFDHYFPRRSAQKLWTEIGKPEIHWFSNLHSSKIFNNAKVRKLVIDFIKNK